ncbi:hypothetical protein VTL71DRAFT_127 [Oculimacula yallundae]|uniref:G-patch domain-containing protein n=1 Tax=Oculimacula yallundae TaxID=86028 RepID=A0ABR4CZ89_9HELO
MVALHHLPDTPNIVTLERESSEKKVPDSVTAKASLDVNEEEWMAAMDRGRAQSIRDSVEKRTQQQLWLVEDDVEEGEYELWTLEVDEAWVRRMKKFYGRMFGINGTWNHIQEGRPGWSNVNRWEIIVEVGEDGEHMKAAEMAIPEGGGGFQSESTRDRGTRTKNALDVGLEGKYNKLGYTSMLKKGWKSGMRLGKSGQGILQPVRASDRRNRTGLGYTPKGVKDTAKAEPSYWERTEDYGKWMIFFRDSTTRRPLSSPYLPGTLFTTGERRYPVTDIFHRLENRVDYEGFYSIIFNYVEPKPKTNEEVEAEKSTIDTTPMTRAELEAAELVEEEHRARSKAAGIAQAKAILAGQILNTAILSSERCRQLARMNKQYKKDGEEGVGRGL